MLTFVGRRILVGIGLVFVASLLVFAATNLLPGDAASAVLGRNASPEALAALRAELELERPLHEQYLDWVTDLAQGDLGRSLTNKQPVTALIGYRVVNTLALAVTAALLLLPLSLVLGTWAGIRAGRRADQAISGLTLAFIALPEFVIASILVLVLSVGLDLLPPLSLVRPGENPFSHPTVLVLPVLTLVLVGVAWMVRYVRAGVASAVTSEYVEMARLNGLPEWRVVLRHVLPNALAPSVQAFALTLLWLLGGVVIVETMFAYPGIGAGLVQAIASRDLPTIQSTAMLIAAVYVGITIAADVLVVLLIPKVRTTK